VRKRVLLLAVALAGLAACNPCAYFAYFEPFAGLRHDLVRDCCECLANNGTRHPGAKCAEVFVDVDGGIVGDAGPPQPPLHGLAAIPDAGSCDHDFQCVGGRTCENNTCTLPDDDNGTVDDDEVPCLCQDDEAQCAHKLSVADTADAVLVTGACITQAGTSPFENGPACAQACQGVINFIPVEPGP
jgi:hypothetical protein